MVRENFCRKCSQYFHNLKIHDEIVHNGKREKRCIFCGFVFISGNSLFDHIIVSHHKKEGCFCNFCDRKFAEYEDLQIHLETHQELFIYHCDKCDRFFSNRTFYRDHICSTDEPPTLFKCLSCLEFFNKEHFKVEFCCNRDFICQDEFNRHKAFYCKENEEEEEERLPSPKKEQSSQLGDVPDDYPRENNSEARLCCNNNLNALGALDCKENEENGKSAGKSPTVGETSNSSQPSEPLAVKFKSATANGLTKVSPSTVGPQIVVSNCDEGSKAQKMKGLIEEFSCSKCQQKFDTKHLLRLHLWTCRTEISKIVKDQIQLETTAPTKPFGSSNRVLQDSDSSSLCPSLEVSQEETNNNVLKTEQDDSGEDSALQTDEEIIEFHCSKCRHKFKTRSSLRCHLLKCKSRTSTPAVRLKKSLKGSFHRIKHKPKNKCRRVYIDGELKDLIESALQDDNLYHCPKPFCEKTFKNKRGLKYHLFAHEGILHYSCQICAKSFVTQSKLKSHSLTHTKIKSYFCPVCNKMFKTRFTQMQHTKIHELKYTCYHCEKEFNRKISLANHIRLTRCCLKYFPCATLYEKHEIAKKHKFICKECDSCYSRRSYLLHHLATIHYHMTTLKSGKYSCLECGRIFSTSHNAARHKRRRHGPENEQIKL